MKQVYINIAVSLAVVLSFVFRDSFGEYLSGIILGLGLAYISKEIGKYGVINTFKVTKQDIRLVNVRAQIAISIEGLYPC